MYSVGSTLLRRRVAAGSAGIAVALFAAAAVAAPPAYQLVGSFGSPGGSFDVGPDGRVYTLSGRTILRQDAVNGSTFSPIAELPIGSVGSFGASFVRFNSTGTRLAIGDGEFNAAASVRIIDSTGFESVPSGTPAASVLTAFVTPNFDAAWDGDRLYVTGARSNDFVPIVNRIDTSLGGPAETVITGIGLASGGIALRGGHLYTGCGFLPTGETRRFDLSVLSGASPATFASGTLIGSYLSASPLDFDASGNLLVGGGDAFSGTSDTGYAAVVDLSDPGNFLQLSPAGSGTTYSPTFNAVTGEVLVYDGATSIFHRYAIPAPGAACMLAMVGISQLRRRRR